MLANTYINIIELHKKLDDELCRALPGFHALMGCDKKLDDELCRALPGFHALMGCDFNPAFFKNGKERPLEIQGKSAKFIRTFIDIMKI
ncbi:hypothetical protein QE152_g23374 [Popillia japonica]|uniref:Uncharacterized protein n=1 Tax=Popillia japonica TaxID=7064 RepID=A0AAW1KI29_POPJA